MKKKVIISISTCVALACAIACFIYIYGITKIATIITIDINPSIEIGLAEDGKVVRVRALNDDAKKIISNDMEGKSLDDTINIITERVIEKGFADDEVVEVIVYSSGNISQEELSNKVQISFEEKNVRADVVFFDDITEEDKAFAKKYDISPPRAAYINAITKTVDNTDVKTLAEKSIGELRETKDTGKYCDKGYELHGDFCYKEVASEPASTGVVCPRGYYEYNDKCYEEQPIEETNNLICRNEFTLQGTNCVRKQTVDAVVTKYTCPNGEPKTKGEVGDAPYNSGPAKDVVCIDPSRITHPVTPCELPASDPTERMSYGGKCYWHRAPVIESGCPGKIQVNGSCWDDASNVYLCPNSKNSNKRIKDDNCYVVLKDKAVPSEYKCDDSSMRLEGNKCIKEEIELAEHERVCPNGYSLVNNDRCINKNKTTAKTDGYVCENEELELKGNQCIHYEMTEAKHN